MKGNIFARGHQIEPSTLPELHGSCRGEGFRDRGQAEKSALAGRNVVLKIGEAKALGPLVLSIFDHGHRQTGDMGRSHEFGDRGIDLGELIDPRLISQRKRNGCAKFC
jgi:hypothetical protein